MDWYKRFIMTSILEGRNFLHRLGKVPYCYDMIVMFCASLIVHPFVYMINAFKVFPHPLLALPCVLTGIPN